MVNPWPRPIQQPHPPVWVPGSGSLSTWDFAAKHGHCYCFLSYFGNNLGKQVMDGYWQFVEDGGHDPNPYRAGFLQLVAVGETDADAEREYYPAHPLLSTTSPCTSRRSSRTLRLPGLPQPGELGSNPGQHLGRPARAAARVGIWRLRREPVRDRGRSRIGPSTA